MFIYKENKSILITFKNRQQMNLVLQSAFASRID